MKNKYIGREVTITKGDKIVQVLVIDVLNDSIDPNLEWYRVYEKNGICSLHKLDELQFKSCYSDRKETYQEKINNTHKSTGWDNIHCEKFFDYVYDYLDACGYFQADFNIHNIPKPDNYIKYIDRDFGTWLLDMALQYNMEQGKEYKCELVNDNLQK